MARPSNQLILPTDKTNTKNWCFMIHKLLAGNTETKIPQGTHYSRFQAQIMISAQTIPQKYLVIIDNSYFYCHIS